jgi:uncharacterized protein YkwD
MRLLAPITAVAVALTACAQTPAPLPVNASTYTMLDAIADISHYRVTHGQTPVYADAALMRLAREQSNNMANRDKLEHDAVSSFERRIGKTSVTHAAENIAIGNSDFKRTLDAWIKSGEHRKNLLLPGATKIGVDWAEATHKGYSRYWTMIIAK